MTAVPPPPLPETAAVPAQRNRLGLLALITGIVAVVLALAPLTSYGAWLVGIGAVVLGIVAILRAGLAKRAGIAGIVLGALAVVLSIVMSVVYTILFVVSSTHTASGYASQSAGAPVGGSGATHTVVYAVTGDGRASAVAYYTVSGGQSGQTTLQDQALPWSKSVTVRGTLTTASSVLTVVGQHAGSGRIGCSITLDGKVVAEQSGEGEGATAQCIYRPEQ